MEKFRPKNSLQEKNVYEDALRRVVSGQFLSDQYVNTLQLLVFLS